jgi:DNA repair protein RecO (recombination protein O)
LRVTTPAFVLRRVRWSESSLILTLYSLDFGRISGMAKGALRPKSKFYGQMEMLSLTEVSLSRREGREIDTVTEAGTVKAHQKLREDPVAYAHACLFAEWMMGLVWGSEPSQPVFHLVDKTLDALEESAEMWPVQCAAVERLLRLSGLAMELDRCCRCGGEDVDGPERVGWRPGLGGVVCGRCLSEGRTVPRGLVRFLRRSRQTPLDRISRTRLWPGGFRQCHDLLREFAENHLGTALKLNSLKVLEDLENA